MDFDALMAHADDIVTSTFQKVDAAAAPIEVTIHYNDGGPDVTVPCVVKNPALEEDYVPGSQDGTTMLMLFIPASGGVMAVRGATATYGGVDYDIVQSDGDRVGALHIRMRRRALPYVL
jgi:hypothetical protein